MSMSGNDFNVAGRAYGASVGEGIEMHTHPDSSVREPEGAGASSSLKAMHNPSPRASIDFYADETIERLNNLRSTLKSTNGDKFIAFFSGALGFLKGLFSLTPLETASKCYKNSLTDQLDKTTAKLFTQRHGGEVEMARTSLMLFGATR